MEPNGVIDAQFNRAVEIVQNLPKTGPIQTGYEDKLNMYRCVVLRSHGYVFITNLPRNHCSLFKQGSPYLKPLCGICLL